MTNYAEIEPVRISEVTQKVLFYKLWQSVSNKSIVSGMWLRVYANTPLWANCFLHLLPSDKYKYFRYYYKNVVLVTPGERGLWLQGTEEERIQYSLDIEEKSRGRQTADWSILKRLEAELKQDYARVFPSTRGIIIGYQYSLNEQKYIIGKLNKEFLNNL